MNDIIGAKGLRKHLGEFAEVYDPNDSPLDSSALVSGNVVQDGTGRYAVQGYNREQCRCYNEFAAARFGIKFVISEGAVASLHYLDEMPSSIICFPATRYIRSRQGRRSFYLNIKKAAR